MILVTGATGFIGKNFVYRILKKKPIKILARPSTDISVYKNNPEVKIDYGDFYTQDHLKSALEGVDVVVHCAGLTMGRNFQEFYQANVCSTMNLVKAMKREGVRKILFLSSQSAGGPGSSSTCIEETTAPAPISFYGLTKKMAEDVLSRSGLDYVILRPCSVYGPFDTEILKFIKLLKMGFCPFIGGDEKYINLIYVKDLVELMMLIIDKDFFNHKVYYVTDGVCYRFEDVIKLIQEILNQKRCVKIYIPEAFAVLFGLLNDLIIPRNQRIAGFDKMKEMTGKYWICSNSKIIADTGWKPVYDLKKGMEETIAWYRQNNFLP
ncbi:MAG: NAD(P)-dependent oxidoreductase [candidate division WOR-3 bacterium]|nr:NAD(P)-dependent oxidoreductase [candidate division WOR-3 bacterium]